MRYPAVFLTSALLLAACAGGGTGTSPVPAPLPPQPGAASGGNIQTATVAKTYQVVDLGANFRPTALNNHNDVVGFDWFNGGTQPAEAALYSGGTIHDLGTLPGATGSMANGIDDAGSIIGTATGPGANQTAALFSPSSAPQSLGTGNGVASSGNAISSTGELVGTAFSATDGSSGSCYNQIAIFDGHGGAQQYANNALAVGVNKTGSIVYDVYNDHSVSFKCEQRLRNQRRVGTFTNLNARLAAGCAAWTIEQAEAINDQGDIVGVGTIGNQQHGILLIPQS